MNQIKKCFFFTGLEIVGHSMLRGIRGWKVPHPEFSPFGVESQSGLILFCFESHSGLSLFYVESYSEFSPFGIESLSVLSLFYVKSHSLFNPFSVKSVPSLVHSGLSPFWVETVLGWAHSGLSGSIWGSVRFRVESIRFGWWIQVRLNSAGSDNPAGSCCVGSDTLQDFVLRGIRPGWQIKASQNQTKKFWDLAILSIGILLKNRLHV
jgi:hypothetical protein